ncbi:MAG: hypothetical protein ACTSU5_17340 [Promethearchaeota archaeon]
MATISVFRLRGHIESVQVQDIESRYSSFEIPGWQNLEVHDANSLVDRFKKAMESIYGKKFDDLDSVKDLRAILSRHPGDLPVHYPRPAEDRDPRGRNFQWFVDNQRSTRQFLALAPSDRGLTIPRGGRHAPGGRSGGRPSGGRGGRGGGGGPSGKGHRPRKKTTNRGSERKTTPKEEYLLAIAEVLQRRDGRPDNLSKLLLKLEKSRLVEKGGYKGVGFSKFKDAVLAAIEQYQIPCEIDPQANFKWEGKKKKPHPGA